MSDRETRFQIGDYWLDRHANGTWYATWYDRAANQTRRKSLRTRRLAEAKERLAAFYHANRFRRLEPAETVKVNELIGLYSERHLSKTADPENTRAHLRGCIDPIGELTVADFGIATQEKIFGAMLDAGLKPATVRRRLSAVRAAINWAFQREMVDRVPPFISIKVDNQRRRALTMPELQALWQAEMPDHTRAFLLLAMATIARKTAILQLTRSQCDLDRGLIDLNLPGGARTNKGRPVLPMVPSIRPLVEAAEGPLVAYKGQPVRDIKHSFAAAVHAAGLGDVVPKDIRTTMATLLHERGVPLNQIDDAQGHTDSRSTARRHYIQVRPEYLREWAVMTETIIREATGRDPHQATPPRQTTTRHVQMACKAEPNPFDFWSEWQDSNLRPLPPEDSALPD